MPTHRPLACIVTFAALATACASSASDPGDAGPDPTTTVPATTVADAPTDDAPSRSGEQTVVSDDGLLTVVFPAGSFDAGVEPSIELIPGAATAQPTYRLLPVGAELPAPADVELRLDADSMLELQASEEPLALGLSADDGALAELEFMVEQTEIVIRAELFRLAALSAFDGRDFAMRQISPAATTPVRQEFTAEAEFTDLVGTIAPVQRSRWTEDEDYTIADPMAQCPATPGTWDRSAWMVIDAEPTTAVLATFATECVEPQVETALELDPPPAGEAYTGELFLRTSSDGTVAFGFPAEEIPDGGTIGVDIVDESFTWFLECFVERRDSEEPGSQCVLRDQTFVAEEIIELEESEEDQIVWASTPEELGGQLLDMFIDRFGLDELGFPSLTEITLRKFLRDGAAFAASIDTDDDGLRRAIEVLFE